MGPPVPVVENPPPRLWIEKRVAEPDYELAFTQSDSRYLIKTADMLRMCRARTCIRYYATPYKCGYSIHVYSDDGERNHQGGDYYTLSGDSRSALAVALGSIWVLGGPSGNDPLIPLNRLSGLEDVASFTSGPSCPKA